MSILIIRSVFLIVTWFTLTEPALAFFFFWCWRLEEGIGGPTETHEDWLTDLVAAEQNNWVIPDRRTVMKCNGIIALVVTVWKKDIECYARSITVVISGFQGPADCELVLVKGEKEISKSC